ncbi:MAG: HAD family phosphatase [Clostridiales bacterium]|nr:HAD family phosphatase [Clostridiales bacterium]
MIKNIVFDMGKVLVDYDAKRVLTQYIDSEEDQYLVCLALFSSGEWTLLDMGVLSHRQALTQVCGRLPQRLHEAAALCLANWHKYNMWPMAEMEPLIRQLKARGYRLYICSNASSRLLDCYEKVIPAIECFDGILFSAEVKCIKPQKEIYQHLFERFNLDPSECFFIDDLQLNIDGARVCGMDGYCFADGNIAKLEAALAALEQK